jgi:hypothetical protein
LEIYSSTTAAATDVITAASTAADYKKVNC